MIDRKLATLEQAAVMAEHRSAMDTFDGVSGPNGLKVFGVNETCAEIGLMCYGSKLKRGSWDMTP